MKERIKQSRRTAIKTGLGVAGAAGLAGIGYSWPVKALDPNTANGQHRFSGLTPLYSSSPGGKQRAPSPQALSTTPDEHVRALLRLTFGYKPQDLTAFLALDDNFDGRLQTYVDAQLNGYQPAWPPANDPPLSAIVNDPASNWETMGDSLTTLWQERVVADPPWPLYQYPVIETQLMGLNRAVYSQWQLAEILADFWHTHFSVEGVRFGIAPVFVHYDRDVIRAHMLGNFRQMLEAVTTSTAMMYYLDNVSNTRWGPNENFAREVQELHTLGAVNSFGFTPENEIPEATPLIGSSTVLPTGLKAGYSEADVVQVTLCLTGWTISNQWTDGNNTGEYIYLDSWHEPAAKRVLGQDIVATGENETREVLDLLAKHPNTARYVCRKLCTRLISDDPPESIVEAAAVVFNDQWQAADQLKQVVRTIILSTEFKDAANWGAKTKRPFEIIAGAARSCGGLDQHLVRPDEWSDWIENYRDGQNFQFSLDIFYRMTETGGMPFSWVTPDGFPDRKEAWLGSTPLIMSWRAVNALFNSYYVQNPNDDPNTWIWFDYGPIDVVAKTMAALTQEQRTANNIVDYWINRFLGYDAANAGSPQIDATIRAQLVAFMQQDAVSANTPLPIDFEEWDPLTWIAYCSQRLRTLVASIAMLPDTLLR